MSWITRDWRLKLLAVGLSVLMLGAVAFSQNPPTVKTLSVSIRYVGADASGLILITPPTKTSVTVTGLADTISAVSPSNVEATVDVSKANAGTSVSINMTVVSHVGGTSVQNPTVPVALNIDHRAQVRLPVAVRTPSVAPGWQVTRADATHCPSIPCAITFDGPVSWETNLKAFADFPGPVENSTTEVFNQPVVLEQNGKPLDLTVRTVPDVVLDITTVTIDVDAKSGTTSRQVALIDAPPSNPPPSCYRVTGIAIDPLTVVIIGPPEALVRIPSITLPAVDLSKSTATTTFKVTITYPNGITSSTATARVTYTISQNPNCASPTP